MMKRIGFCLILFFVFFQTLSPSVLAGEETKVNLAVNARSAILMDMDTGTILFEKNANEKLPPASITKIMTMLLIMEALDRGEIKLTDKVRTSEFAASMGGSQIFLEVGEEMTVDDLLKGIAVASGNDASVAMAEFLSGTEEAFVAKMNQKAKELGLHNTNFVNSNGLSAPNHFSSAHDIAVMSRELLRYESITKYTSIYQDYLRKDTQNPFWLVNTNKLVRFYEGLDGLKTGFTDEARYCLSATAKKDNLRAIAVVMGEPDVKVRNKEITQLLNYAFSQYASYILYSKDAKVGRIKVDKGSVEEIDAVTPHQFGILTKRGENPENYKQEIIISKYMKAPIKKGEVIGHLFVRKDGQKISQINLVASEKSDKANIWKTFSKSFRALISF